MKKNIIIRMGLVLSTIILTSIAIIISIIITLILFYLLGITIIFRNVILAVIIPLCAAPPIIIFYGKLLIKITKTEEQMRFVATYDQLTNLLTRHAMFETGNTLLNHAIRNKTPISILYCDLDFFKRINDLYGHLAGDMVLREIGSLINNEKRKSDLAARIGGEEFLIVLPETNKTNALIFAKKLKEKISSYVMKYKDNIINVTISIGICETDNGVPTTLDNLISKADKALYVSKKNGRNKITVY